MGRAATRASSLSSNVGDKYWGGTASSKRGQHHSRSKCVNARTNVQCGHSDRHVPRCALQWCPLPLLPRYSSNVYRFAEGAGAFNAAKCDARA